LKKIVFIAILSAILIVGCMPSDSAIQTALAETMDNQPTASQTMESTNTQTSTPLPSETSTQMPSETSTYTASQTATEPNTLTPTPDLRTITIDPHSFLLEKADLLEKAQ
jgi:hypothetical protein